MVKGLKLTKNSKEEDYKVLKYHKDGVVVVSYNIPNDAPISNFVNTASSFNVPDAVFTGFYSDNTSDNYYYSDATATLQAVPESQAFSLEDEEYKYLDHFNF